jgi:hypothetical protein
MPDITPPTLASLPTQLLTSAPAWFWRYASVVAIVFLMAVGGDYYLGSPGSGLIRAWAVQKAKAVETRAVPDADTAAKIDALLTQTAKISSMHEAMALKEREFKALQASLEYTIGRVGTLEAYMAEKPAAPRKAKAVTVVVKPEPSEPVVKIGGAP